MGHGVARRQIPPEIRLVPVARETGAAWHPPFPQLGMLSRLEPVSAQEGFCEPGLKGEAVVLAGDGRSSLRVDDDDDHNPRQTGICGASCPHCPFHLAILLFITVRSLPGGLVSHRVNLSTCRKCRCLFVLSLWAMT